MTTSLVDIALHLVRAADAAALCSPLLVGLRSGPPPELDVHDLPTLPAQLLLGWRAPAAWSGIVLVGPRPHTGRLVALAVDHRCPGVVVGADPGPIPAARSPTADQLLRVLGLPTPAPDRSVSSLAAHVWLHRIARIALDHPHAHRLERNELDRLWPLDTLVGRAPQHWTALAAALADPPLRLDSDTIAWFDAGSFERWLVAELPEPASLLGALRAVLAPRSARWVSGVVAEAGIWTHPGCEPVSGLASFQWTSCTSGAP